ncbi:MAG: hypothetical protein U0271_01465 [Polyangiaceae bacterium]
MCLFSRPVPFVSKTNIYAREAPGVGQHLAYSMTFTVAESLAMILPLPVAPGSGDSAVSFTDLSGYPELFADLQKGFPEETPLNRGGHVWSGGGAASPQPLPVVNMGSFEASFVPTMNDFTRLDERFRIPAETLVALGDYGSYGFAVIKLRPGAEQRLHPIALTFPRADPTTLYFPTTHLHDGKVRERAEFDHSLFCQRVARPMAGIPASVAPEGPWRRSSLPLRSFARPMRAQGLLDGEAPCLRRVVRGTHPNHDIFVPA